MTKSLSTFLCYKVELAVRLGKDKGKDTEFPVIKTCVLLFPFHRLALCLWMK